MSGSGAYRKISDHAAANGSLNGSSAEPGEPPGHTAGAISVPFTALANPLAGFVSAAELKAQFHAARLHPSDEIVVNCHSGNTAAIAYLAARMLGVPARPYLGRWRDRSAPAAR